MILSGCAAARNNTDRTHGIPIPFEVRALSPDRPSPQAAEMTAVRWKAEVSGGVGERDYMFWLSDDREITGEQKGHSVEWVWTPRVPGSYRVKVAVRDSIGNRVESQWSPEYVVVPRLEVSPPVSDLSPPQAAKMAAVRWSVSAKGGVGDRTYEFVVTDGKEEEHGPVGPSSSWEWRPELPGVYRVKAVVRDAAGNRVESGWSEGYEVAPTLVLTSLSPDRPSPQAAKMTAVRWSVSAKGGVGDRTYEFVVTDGKEEEHGPVGPSSSWEWRPELPGVYRVKAVVRDAAGNRVESGWSSSFEIMKVSLQNIRIAVLPVENLSGTAAPLKEIRESLMEGLKARGFTTLDVNLLEKFMARHRVRYTGGVDTVTALALREQTGSGAVLISSLELYDDMNPPKVSLTSRLVSTGDPPIILWMDTAAMAGDDSPGLLDLGLIEDPRVLLGKVLGSLSRSLADSLSGRRLADISGGNSRKFQPKASYKSSAFDPEAPQSLAVLPFLNQSLRKHAGEIMMLHLVREMTKLGYVRVVEPGVVRRELLTYRIIMEDGVSLANADTVFGALEADLLLTGKVFDYLDYQGSDAVPVVDFSLAVIERRNREVVWSSKSYNKGTDGVYFFDRGRERTASSMASEMARIVRERLWK